MLQTRRARNIRVNILHQCGWALAHAGDIHYAQIRPAPLDRWKAHRLPITTDCSGSTDSILFSAGAPDPSGFHYNGQGNTQTFIDHLPHISRLTARRGDLVVFGGPMERQHVVILLERPLLHPNPMVFSHGQEAGPFRFPLSVEIRAHAGQPVYYLRSVPTRF